MRKISTEIDLRDAIILLEGKQAMEQKRLRGQMNETFEVMKPINLIKSVFNEVVSSPEMKTDLLNTAAGLTAGYVTKTVFESISQSPMRKLFGTVLMIGITNAVTKHPDVVKALGHKFFKMIHSKTD
jgi:predicted site-specific integrase-resolvase